MTTATKPAYLVDSDICILSLGLRNARSLTDQLASIAPEGLAISVITYGEVSEGVTFSRRPMQNQQRWREFLAPFDIINVTAAIAEVWAEIRGGLRARGLTTPDNDLIIAATALYFDLTLLTNNRRHFERVDGLRLLRPAIEAASTPG